MKTNSDVSRVLEFRREFREKVIPKWYHGLAHVTFNSCFLLGGLTFFLSKIQDLRAVELLMIPLTLVIGNFAVYVIHRFPLHRHYPLIGHHTYRIHSKLHHQFFTHELTTVESLKDFYILFFPPWTVLLFLFIHCPMMYALATQVISKNAAYLHLAMSAFYFMLYEVFHFVSHLPKGHWILKVRHFARMREHHTLHHNPRLMYHYNFNVVFPLFDFIFKSTYGQSTYVESTSDQHNRASQGA